MRIRLAARLLKHFSDPDGRRATGKRTRNDSGTENRKRKNGRKPKRQNGLKKKISGTKLRNLEKPPGPRMVADRVAGYMWPETTGVFTFNRGPSRRGRRGKTRGSARHLREFSDRPRAALAPGKTLPALCKHRGESPTSSSSRALLFLLLLLSCYYCYCYTRFWAKWGMYKCYLFFFSV